MFVLNILSVENTTQKSFFLSFEPSEWKPYLLPQGQELPVRVTVKDKVKDKVA
uniref:Uncharacterized protein n=1 Tax=Anguilla anguilla TaxID=7936 RepID=A0A0E9QLN6_ANGAN